MVVPTECHAQEDWSNLEAFASQLGWYELFTKSNKKKATQQDGSKQHGWHEWWMFWDWLTTLHAFILVKLVIHGSVCNLGWVDITWWSGWILDGQPRPEEAPDPGANLKYSSQKGWLGQNKQIINTLVGHSCHDAIWCSYCYLVMWPF